MVQIEADKNRNLLEIRFFQRVVPADLKDQVERVKSLLADLAPDFRLLADLSGLESMDLACAPYIKDTMDLCNRKGVSKVVRIIPDPRKDIGLNIMSYFHYDRDVRIVTCETRAEAEQALSD